MKSVGRRLSLAVAAFVGIAAMGQAASAQVYYAPDQQLIYPFGVPPDESYGARPALEIFPYAYGAPAVRIVRRCAYPDGWNATDFSRDLNGIPPGIDHTCPVDVPGRVRARY